MTRTGQPIRPVVIAHRGASGYMPEHTLAAKALAHEMGADYLEQDIVATADDELVVLHDIYLDRVTDVAQQYPQRCRPDGRYYVRDFRMEELRSLEVHHRNDEDGSPVYPGRTQTGDEASRVHTFAEELAFAAELQADGGNAIGVYPEIKSPAWHRSEGIDIGPRFLRDLQNYGYSSSDDPVYVQCFDPEELLYLRNQLGCDLRMIQLIGDNSWGEADTDFEEMLETRGLENLARTVDGIGPWINQLYHLGPNGQIEDSGLVSRAHSVGLAVHPYTFRADDLPPGFESFDELLSYFIDELCVDGVFTDFPDLVKNRNR